jgi:hypothetical protein
LIGHCGRVPEGCLPWVVYSTVLFAKEPIVQLSKLPKSMSSNVLNNVGSNYDGLFRGFPDLQRFENPETGEKNDRQKHVITYPVALWVAVGG